jgi:hypothetical protein
MQTRGILHCIAITVVSISAANSCLPTASGKIVVNYHLGNAPASAAANIIDSMNSAVGVFNEWSNYNELINVHYSLGVATSQGGFDGVVTFGPNPDFHTPSTAWREVLHTMGSGTFPAYDNFIGAGVWTGAQGVAMSEYYYPGVALLADNDIHSVSGHNTDLLRQGVHIMGAMRADMGLLNGNYLGDPGDFNLSGAIGDDDYGILVANLHKDYTAQGPAAAFYNGDMNSDLLINFFDVVAFRAKYDVVHGLGAFQRLHAIPEPAAWILLSVGTIGLTSRTRRARSLPLHRGGHGRHA